MPRRFRQITPLPFSGYKFTLHWACSFIALFSKLVTASRAISEVAACWQLSTQTGVRILVSSGEVRKGRNVTGKGFPPRSSPFSYITFLIHKSEAYEFTIRSVRLCSRNKFRINLSTSIKFSREFMPLGLTLRTSFFSSVTSVMSIKRQPINWRQ
jgi:hypothetical protein